MGAGIALEFKLRYPDMYDDYVERCKNNKVIIGNPYIYEITEEKWIMNFPTKNHWRYPSKLEWIEAGFEYFIKNYKKRDIGSIAFPKLGSSNGKLKWEDVNKLMINYLKNLDIDIYICLDEKEEAEGIEKMMIELINNFSPDYLIKNKITTKLQAYYISQCIPVKRFWQLSVDKKLSKKSYEKLFKFCYDKVQNESSQQKKYESNNEQLSFIAENI